MLCQCHHISHLALYIPNLMLLCASLSVLMFVELKPAAVSDLGSPPPPALTQNLEVMKVSHTKILQEVGTLNTQLKEVSRDFERRNLKI